MFAKSFRILKYFLKFVMALLTKNSISILVQWYQDLFGGNFYEGQNHVKKVFYKSNWISSYSTAYGSRVDAERSYVDDCSKSPFC